MRRTKSLVSTMLAGLFCVSVAGCSVADPAKNPHQRFQENTQTTSTENTILNPAKFPRTDPKLLEALAFVNAQINTIMTYESDMVQYGVSEKWVWLPESMKGDCEDYALAKLAILQQSGFPIVSHSRVTFLVTPVGGHAVLEVLMQNGEVAVMDNNFMELMTREELIRDHGYQFYDW